jgi:hypothetical protein
MTSTVITDEMVKTAIEAAYDTQGVSFDMRAALLAVAPMILEAAAKVAYPDPLYMAGNDRDENGNLAPGSPYDRGRYDAAKDIRALKGGK